MSLRLFAASSWPYYTSHRPGIHQIVAIQDTLASATAILLFSTQRIQGERENGSVIAGSPNQMPGIRARDVVKRDTRPFVFSTKSLSCRSINPGDSYNVASSR